jgi:hypothetical protein
MGGRFHRPLPAALDNQAPGLRVRAAGIARPPGATDVRAAGHGQARDRADRGQRLAAEAERGDVHQIVAGQLGGGVALDRQPDLLGGHAATVVGHRNERAPALAQVDVDVARAGVEGVLDQLLDRGRRTLDHLAGGNPVDQSFGQPADRHRTLVASASHHSAASSR